MSWADPAGATNRGSDTGGIAAPCEQERAGSAQNLVIVHALEGGNRFIVVECLEYMSET